VKISPLDIKKQEFAVKFRGYAPDEVHSYLEMIASELEDILRKNLELEHKIESMQERLESYKRMETILQETLISTQKAAEETRAMAEKKAEAMMAEAQLKVQKIEGDVSEKLVKTQREIADLTNQKDSFTISFRSLLETQLSLLDLTEKRHSGKDEIPSLKRKPDLSDEELEQIVDEFERKLTSEKGRVDNSSSRREK
jgi:cell division initiation protein